MSLFEQKNQTPVPVSTPLAERIRPQTLDEFVGQDELVGQDGPIRKAIEVGEIQSMIFWGPPGSGKTTLARLIAKVKDYKFIGFSAVLSGVDEVRRIIKEATLYRAQGRRTILFIDEIHRFNKAQQDAFLPSVEDGTLILIGATTENPSFEVISPLLSRTTVYVFKQLGGKEIIKIIDRALTHKDGLSEYAPQLTQSTKEELAQISDGDARTALNILEFAVRTTLPCKWAGARPAPTISKSKREITSEIIKRTAQYSHLLYDKKGEEHYNLISALIKSMRGSDPDASLYWLARMVESGEDPLFIVRRLVIFASEDIGNADPQALMVATSCKSAIEFVGMPEGFLPLSQTVIYLATAPKSNSSLMAYKRAMEDVKKHGSLPVPLHLRNPVTQLMKDAGYGKGYKYPHNYEPNGLQETYLPEKLKPKKYYVPTDIGFELKIKERMKNKRLED